MQKNPERITAPEPHEIREFAVAFAVFLGFILAWIPSGDLAMAGSSWRFALMGMAAGIASLVVVHRFEVLPARLRPWVFWAVAVLLRLAVLPVAPADDFWRYLWEGRVQVAGYNPYLFEPSALRLLSLRTPWWHLISHPDWASVYPPGAQLVFSRLATVTEYFTVWKAFFGLADLAVVALLLRLNRGAGRYRVTAWYAWNPLVIYCFAGGGHFDSLFLASLLLAVVMMDRVPPSDQPGDGVRTSILAAGLFLGLSISLKAVPLMLVPLWALALRRRALWLVPGLAVPVLLALMFGYPGVDIFEPLRAFAAQARSNDLFWWLVELVTGPRAQNGLYDAISLGVCLILAVVFRNDWRRGTLWILGACLILSPVLHPWYVTWILPIACWRRNVPWFVLSISVFGYFLMLETTAFSTAWDQAVWQRLLIILPPLVACIRQWMLRARNRPAEPVSEVI